MKYSKYLCKFITTWICENRTAVNTGSFSTNLKTN